MSFWACGEGNFVLDAGGSWSAPSGAGSCASRSAFTVRLGLLSWDRNGGRVLRHAGVRPSPWRQGACRTPTLFPCSSREKHLRGWERTVSYVQAPGKPGHVEQQPAPSVWPWPDTALTGQPTTASENSPFSSSTLEVQGHTLCFLPTHDIFQVYFNILPVPWELPFLSAFIVPTHP